MSRIYNAVFYVIMLCLIIVGITVYKIGVLGRYDAFPFCIRICTVPHKYFCKIFVFEFKYFFKYIVSINILFSLSHIMPAKLITITATSPNSANY